MFQNDSLTPSQRDVSVTLEEHEIQFPSHGPSGERSEECRLFRLRRARTVTPTCAPKSQILKRS